MLNVWRENRELRKQVLDRDERIEQLTAQVQRLAGAAASAARAMDKTDAAEIAGLVQQITAKDRELEIAGKQIALLHKQVDAAIGYTDAELKQIAAHDHPFEVAS